MKLCIFSSQEEKDKWIEDLNDAVSKAKSRNDDKLSYPSLKSSTSKLKYADNSLIHSPSLFNALPLILTGKKHCKSKINQT